MKMFLNQYSLLHHIFLLIHAFMQSFILILGLNSKTETSTLQGLL